MLTIVVPPLEKWDDDKEEFVYGKEQKLQLEHSLISISKWESKWHKPFYRIIKKTNEEMFDYIRCMTVTPNVDPEVYFRLSADNIKDISDYIENPMTAKKFPSDYIHKKKHSNKTITAETIYYEMAAFNIPFECEKWHINRLIALIRTCAAEQNPESERLTPQEKAEYYDSINEERKRKLHTKG